MVLRVVVMRTYCDHKRLWYVCRVRTNAVKQPVPKEVSGGGGGLVHFWQNLFCPSPSMLIGFCQNLAAIDKLKKTSNDTFAQILCIVTTVAPVDAGRVAPTLPCVPSTISITRIYCTSRKPFDFTQTSCPLMHISHTPTQS